MWRSKLLSWAARSAVFRYGIAVLTVATAFGITKRTHLYLNWQHPFITFFLAAMALVFWYLGLGPGVLAVVLSSVLWGFLHAPLATDTWFIINYVLFAGLAGWFSASRRRAERLLSQERSELEVKVAERTAKLRALSASLRSAREEEGTRISRELHDELGSALTSLKWDIEGFGMLCLEQGSQTDASTGREKLKGILRLIDATIDTVVRISSELRPSVLDDLGLVAAINWQAGQFEARSGAVCQVDSLVKSVDLSQEKATAVFRILQEALTNVLRHAHATKVNISIAEEDGEFVFEIRDNGRGITEDEKAASRSLGLIGMRERVQLVGGEIEITGVGERGTVLTVLVPRDDRMV